MALSAGLVSRQGYRRQQNNKEGKRREGRMRFCGLGYGVNRGVRLGDPWRDRVRTDGGVVTLNLWSLRPVTELVGRFVGASPQGGQPSGQYRRRGRRTGDVLLMKLEARHGWLRDAFRTALRARSPTGGGRSTCGARTHTVYAVKDWLRNVAAYAVCCKVMYAVRDQ
eukprot:IDg3705t1